MNKFNNLKKVFSLLALFLILIVSGAPAEAALLRRSSSASSLTQTTASSEQVQIANNDVFRNRPPVINGVSGPTVLNVNQQGTFTVSSYDPEQGILKYSVKWGDESSNRSNAETSTQSASAQTVTFSHTYLDAGVYTPVFTVQDEAGLSAMTSISVNVGPAVTKASITVLTPNGGENWLAGYPYKLSWSSSNAPANSWVALFLLPQRRLIAQGLPATGDYNWKIPDKFCKENRCDLPIRGDNSYWIESRLYAGNSFCENNCPMSYLYPRLIAMDHSDQAFTISAPANTNNNVNLNTNGNNNQNTNGNQNSNSFLSIRVFGSTLLQINQAGTYTVSANTSGSSTLRYNVHWGDENRTMNVISDESQTLSSQTAVFTHAYAAAGTYVPIFTVTNASGFSVSARMTVQVVRNGSNTNVNNSNGNPSAGFEDEVIVNNNTSVTNPFVDMNMLSLEGRAAAELYYRGVIGGFPDGEFKGARTANRAETAKFLLLARYSSVADVGNNGRFPDVVDGQWYTKFVVTAANYGIISGYPDGNFRPQYAVNTAEFLKMLTLAFGLEQNLSYSYSDVSASDWFAAYAGIAQKYDLFPNRPSGQLQPGKLLTRNEIAVAIYQYLSNR